MSRLYPSVSEMLAESLHETRQELEAERAHKANVLRAVREAIEDQDECGALAFIKTALNE